MNEFLQGWFAAMLGWFIMELIKMGKELHIESKKGLKKEVRG